MSLRVENICCGYEGHEVVHDLSFEATTGQIVSILGPNGVGKTTLFKAILGFIKPDSGKVILDGKDLTHFSRKQIARQIAYVPQMEDVPFSFSVIDFVLMGRFSHMSLLALPNAHDYEIAHEALHMMGIDELSEKPCTEISGGERQMMVIARALAQQPRYLIMDEPTAALDFGNQVHALERILELADKDIGIIMTTHNPDHCFYTDSDIVLIQHAGCQRNGTCKEVLTADTLGETYGITVRVTSVIDENGQPVACCVPLLEQPRV